MRPLSFVLILSVFISTISALPTPASSRTTQQSKSSSTTSASSSQSSAARPPQTSGLTAPGPAVSPQDGHHGLNIDLSYQEGLEYVAAPVAGVLALAYGARRWRKNGATEASNERVLTPEEQLEKDFMAVASDEEKEHLHSIKGQVFQSYETSPRSEYESMKQKQAQSAIIEYQEDVISRSTKGPNSRTQIVDDSASLDYTTNQTPEGAFDESLQTNPALDISRTSKQTSDQFAEDISENVVSEMDGFGAPVIKEELNAVDMLVEQGTKLKWP